MSGEKSSGEFMLDNDQKQKKDADHEQSNRDSGYKNDRCHHLHSWKIISIILTFLNCIFIALGIIVLAGMIVVFVVQDNKLSNC